MYLHIYIYVYTHIHIRLCFFGAVSLIGGWGGGGGGGLCGGLGGAGVNRIKYTYVEKHIKQQMPALTV